MIIHFPAMLQEYLVNTAPQGGLFFDAGFTEEIHPEQFRPQGFLLSPAKARRLIEDSLRFTEQFRAPGEMAVHAIFQEMEDREHSWTIRSELEQRLTADAGIVSTKTTCATNAKHVLLAESQFMLLLAYSCQQRACELIELQRNMRQAREKFNAGLGMPNDHEDTSTAQTLAKTFAHAGQLDESLPMLPWPLLLGAMAVWLPQGTVLATSMPEIICAWKESAINFVPAKKEFALPSGWLVSNAPAWQLAGKPKPLSKTHWCKEFVVAIPEEEA